MKESLQALIKRRLSRRDAMKLVGAGCATVLFAAESRGATVNWKDPFGFVGLDHGTDDALHIAPGHEAQVLIRWGDPVLVDAPPLDIERQSTAAQLGQFGYNNDFTAFMPLPRGSTNSSRGLLCVNHEYPEPARMAGSQSKLTAERTELEMAAVGHSVIEVELVEGKWRVVGASRFSRRINALDTPIEITGPAAGHPRMRTVDDPEGRWVMGTFANCSGGVTPYHTVLIAEENFDKSFIGSGKNTDEARNHAHFRMGRKPYQQWGQFADRFNADVQPTAPNRYGWIVEYDPYSPSSTPKKRTALGRFKHECATTAVAPDGRLVVYSADDEANQFIYRFVSRRPFVEGCIEANEDLLDDGTLYVGRFDDSGRLDWLPLVHGHGPLISKNNFHDQADVLIETRRAAQLLGATPMDRPEGIAVDPHTGHVFVMLTQGLSRPESRVDQANPRPENLYGHILEIAPPGSPDHVDHAADAMKWEILLLAGNPMIPEHAARYNPLSGDEEWLSNPDNCTFDPWGRLWVATDLSGVTVGSADGLYVVPVRGAARARPRCFARVPTGAELCGPTFTPDGCNLFFSVQHPGEGSTFEKPSTRWPDFDESLPPRPSVVVVRREDGGPIGRKGENS